MIWKLIFNVAKFMKECKEDKINAYAAQSAFFILLAIIPFLMVFLSLIQYTPITESMLLTLYEDGLPGYISPFFITITDEIYNRSFGITAVSAVVAIWSASFGAELCEPCGLCAEYLLVSGIEEKEELVNPDAENFCKEEMSEFVYEYKNGKCKYYLQYLDQYNCHFSN